MRQTNISVPCLLFSRFHLHWDHISSCHQIMTLTFVFISKEIMLDMMIVRLIKRQKVLNTQGKCKCFFVSLNRDMITINIEVTVFQNNQECCVVKRKLDIFFFFIVRN